MRRGLIHPDAGEADAYGYRPRQFSPRFAWHSDISRFTSVKPLAPGRICLLVLEHERTMCDQALFALAQWNEREMETIARFRSFEARTTWCVSRYLMSLVFSNLFDAPWSSSLVPNDEGGKPRFSEGGLRFNLSHGVGCVMLALADRIEVGCDLESRERRAIDFRGLATEHFSPHESMWIEQGECEQECWERFLLLWVQKEAKLKAVGCGLAGSLADVRAILSEAPFRSESDFCFRFGSAQQFIGAVSNANHSATLYPDGGSSRPPSHLELRAMVLPS